MKKLMIRVSVAAIGIISALQFMQINALNPRGGGDVTSTWSAAASGSWPLD